MVDLLVGPQLPLPGAVAPREELPVEELPADGELTPAEACFERRGLWLVVLGFCGVGLWVLMGLVVWQVWRFLRVNH